jgi:uncharacterized protein YcaQ
MSEQISPTQARRIALAAQGFGSPQSTPPGRAQIRRIVDRLGVVQIDSVNVLARAHYMPAFSRRGSYDRELLDRIAWGRKSERRLFEYWAHEASLLPIEFQPLLRWRMARADRGEAAWTTLKQFARDHRATIDNILARIRDEGPLGGSDFSEGKSRSGWWQWGDTKRALEWLFWAGHLTTSTRRASFERVYDLPERVIPAVVLAMPTPSEADAQRALVAHAGRALGIATESDLRDYYRMSPAETRAAIASLVEEGVLQPANVEGWASGAYIHRDARRKRRIAAAALLAPFDPLIWHRPRAERLFGFRYRIEIYTPAAKRTHGYYVLPFLLGDRLVARVDLKSDRQAGVLRVQSLHLEPEAPAETRDALDAELRSLGGWLGLANGVAGPVEG